MHDLGKGVSQPTSDRLSLAHRMDVVPRTRVAPAPFPAVHPFVINVVLSLFFNSPSPKFCFLLGPIAIPTYYCRSMLAVVPTIFFPFFFSSFSLFWLLGICPRSMIVIHSRRTTPSILHSFLLGIVLSCIKYNSCILVSLSGFQDPVPILLAFFFLHSFHFPSRLVPTVPPPGFPRPPSSSLSPS